MLRTQVDIVSLMKKVSENVADSFDSASIVAEYASPKELLDSSEIVFDKMLNEFLDSFRKDFQAAYVEELMKQLSEQSVKFK